MANWIITVGLQSNEISNHFEQSKQWAIRPSAKYNNFKSTAY